MDNPIHILLVEDNPGDARLIREMLHGSDDGEFALTVVETLSGAVENVQRTGYDLILLDLSLPDSLGIDTLLKARAQIPDAAIVVLTGFDDQRVGIHAVQIGAQDYLVKDQVDALLLRRTARYAIERYRSEAALRHSEEAYRSLIDDVFDTSKVAVIILDQTFMIVWCNAAMEDYFGIVRDQILGRDKRLVIEDTLKCVFADRDDYSSRLLAEYDRQQFTDHFECHVLPGLNREERWLEHWSQPIRTGMYAGGRIVHYTDITDRKRLEFAEQEQRRFAEGLLDTAAILTSTLELDEVLDRILANIEVVVPHTRASITLMEENGLRVARQRKDANCNTTEVGADHLSQLEHIPLQLRAIDSGEAIIVADLRTNDQFAEVAARAHVCAYAGVPIRLQQKVIGFFNIFHQNADAFGEGDVARLTAFAQQSAIAIQNARLYRQSRRLAAMDERQRLARELHDSVSQTLFTCSAMTESALRRWDKQPKSAYELMTDVHRLTLTAVSEMRILLLELRPDALTKVSLKQLFEQYLSPIQTRRGFKLIMEIDDGPPLPPDVQIAFYRITQEALNNIDKHADASVVCITVHDYPGRLELTIEDDGTGFEVDKVSPTSLGLGIMRERAEAINASLKIESQVAKGTQMKLVWTKQRDSNNER